MLGACGAEVAALPLQQCGLCPGQGQRDGGANGVVVGDSGACGDVHHGRCGADYAEGCAEDIIC